MATQTPTVCFRVDVPDALSFYAEQMEQFNRARISVRSSFNSGSGFFDPHLQGGLDSFSTSALNLSQIGRTQTIFELSFPPHSDKNGRHIDSFSFKITGPDVISRIRNEVRERDEGSFIRGVTVVTGVKYKITDLSTLEGSQPFGVEFVECVSYTVSIREMVCRALHLRPLLPRNVLDFNESLRAPAQIEPYEKEE